MMLCLPLDYQVLQRTAEDHALLPVCGSVTDSGPVRALEARLSGNGIHGGWQPLDARWNGDSFSAHVATPAGGWYRFEVRAFDESGEPIATAAVEHVGVGEVFVVAGQSNAANHGEVLQNTTTRRVSSFDGTAWRLADDPQPGASGGGGSFLPPFGDGIAEHFGVPVGFIACGQGGSSVREWLPAGATFPNPPTVETNVRRLEGGSWESKGRIYAEFVARTKQLGPDGFRAVLWHQGESDANQVDPSRTLSGSLYQAYLARIIADSRAETGWDAPWFVAQVSYHGPDDQADPDIRAAQAALWQDGIALPGPDTDRLQGSCREANGAGVHFSGTGLRAHAEAWLEQVVPWLTSRPEMSPAISRRAASGPLLFPEGLYTNEIRAHIRGPY